MIIKGKKFIWVGAMLFGVGIFIPAWAGENYTREVALALLDDTLAKGRQALVNEDVSTLRWVLEAATASISDHPKVYALYQDILAKSQNPGCVNLALKFLPENPFSKDKKSKRTAKLTLLRPLGAHPSVWVRWLVTEMLWNIEEKKLSTEILLSLAAEKTWPEKLETELPSVLKSRGMGINSELGGDMNLVRSRAGIINGILEGLFRNPDPRAHPLLKAWLYHPKVLPAFQTAANLIYGESLEKMRQESLDQFEKWKRLAHTFTNEKEDDHE